MAGTALAVGALAVTASLAVGGGLIAVAAVGSARASGVADAAALAAADAASGAATGTPCERAAEVAASAAASVLACDLDGLVATVRIQVRAGPFAPEGRARAGPPVGADP